jgi:hypothetical protein
VEGVRKQRPKQPPARREASNQESLDSGFAPMRALE